MKKHKTIITVIVVVLTIAIVYGLIMSILYEIVDFYNDYQCSTTTDIKWFIENNCMRYMK